MNVYQWIGDLFRRSPFPKTIEGHWYCGEWYLYLGELQGERRYSGTSLNPDPSEVETPATGRVAFNPFRTGHARPNTDGLVDGLIPAIRIGDRIGLYRQIGEKYRKGSHYDGALWDDGYNIDLKFVRSIPADEPTNKNQKS